MDVGEQQVVVEQNCMMLGALGVKHFKSIVLLSRTFRINVIKLILLD